MLERMQQRGLGAELIARVMRLNPNPEPGVMLRGIHLASTAKDRRWQYGDVSKGEVIRRRGRSAWDAVPKGLIRRDGKRAYISRDAFEDNVWMGRP